MLVLVGHGYASDTAIIDAMDPSIRPMLHGRVEVRIGAHGVCSQSTEPSQTTQLVDLATAEAAATTDRPIHGLLTLAHAPVNGGSSACPPWSSTVLSLTVAALLDRISPNNTLKVVANYGVGTDHYNIDGAWV